jgi:predicted metal-binding membrane protein
VSAQAASWPRALAWHHPQWWLVALVVAGWAITLTPTQASFGALCVALGASADNRVVGVLAHWPAMIAAMMLPLALPMARHVASRSLWPNRHGAMGWFTLGYVAPWLLVGLASAVLASLLGESRLVPIIAFIAAAIWHWTTMRRSALRRCHRILSIAPGGAEGRRSCIAFGLFHGRACATTCAPQMIALVLAGHHPAAMAVVTLVTLAERFWLRLPPVAMGCVPLALAASLLA